MSPEKLVIFLLGAVLLGVAQAAEDDTALEIQQTHAAEIEVVAMMFADAVGNFTMLFVDQPLFYFFIDQIAEKLIKNDDEIVYVRNSKVLIFEWTYAYFVLWDSFYLEKTANNTIGREIYNSTYSYIILWSSSYLNYVLYYWHYDGNH